jgi:hypothetical protein
VGSWRLTTTGDGIELDFKAELTPGVYAYVIGEVVYFGSAQRGCDSQPRKARCQAG